MQRHFAHTFSLILAVSLFLAVAIAPCHAANPYGDDEKTVGKTTGSSGSKGGTTVTTENGITTTVTPMRPAGEPPALNPPPQPGAKGVTTASAEFKTWLEKARAQINAWNFPEGIVNKYGKTITRDDFLKAIIWIESNGVHKSPGGKVTTSYVGALGFMQLMPATAKSLGCDAKKPDQNLLAGCKYIKEIFNAAGVADAPTPQEKLIKACVAYNAGPYSNFVKRSWDQLKLGKNYETIGYGLKLKMCLGFELTATEKVLVTKILDCKLSKVDDLDDEYYSNANGLF